MAQQLQPVLMGTKHFRHGYALGVRHVYRGSIPLPTQADEQTLYAIIRNLCELAEDHELSDALLRQDIGIVCGWLATVL